MNFQCSVVYIGYITISNQYYIQYPIYSRTRLRRTRLGNNKKYVLTEYELTEYALNRVSNNQVIINSDYKLLGQISIQITTGGPL